MLFAQKASFMPQRRLIQTLNCSPLDAGITDPPVSHCCDCPLDLASSMLHQRLISHECTPKAGSLVPICVVLQCQ